MADDVTRNAFSDFIGSIDRPEVDRILRRQFLEGVSVNIEDPLGIATAAELAFMKDQVAEQLHRELMGK